MSFSNQHLQESVTTLRWPGMGSWGTESAAEVSVFRGGQHTSCEGGDSCPEDENNLEGAGLKVPDLVV